MARRKARKTSSRHPCDPSVPKLKPVDSDYIIGRLSSKPLKPEDIPLVEEFDMDDTINIEPDRYSDDFYPTRD